MSKLMFPPPLCLPAAAIGLQEEYVEPVQRLKPRPLDNAKAWQAYPPQYVAAILLSEKASLVDCDQSGIQFLKKRNVFRLAEDRLQCTCPVAHVRFSLAIKRTLETGTISGILLHQANLPQQRYCAVFSPHTEVSPDAMEPRPSILCVVHPLDNRRVATTRQLMELFSLSAAEARLARAICQGETVEEYAASQGLKLPTVRTQLRSVFAKTATDRQATLVKLVMGIPCIR